MISCSSDDDTNEPSNIPFSIAQLPGTWKISYFWDRADRTSEYEDYTFTFYFPEPDITVEVGDKTSYGAYSVYEDVINGDAYWILQTSYSTDDAGNTGLTELTEEWVITGVNSSATKIEFRERVSVYAPEILHFEKIQN